MRKITEDAALAVDGFQPFSRSNTTVAVDELGQSRLYLHGHQIAVWSGDILAISMAGWGTPTTRERLNGLFTVLGLDASVNQKNYAQVLTRGDHTTIMDDSAWYYIRA